MPLHTFPKLQYYDSAITWHAAVSCYQKCFRKVETSISAWLRDKLGIAKTANDIFFILLPMTKLFTRSYMRL